MNSQPRLLVVSDEENKRWLLAHYASQAIGNAECALCSSGAEAIGYLGEHGVDAIVADASMQFVSGIELTRWARRHGISAPIVLLTPDPDFEAEALSAGATLVLSSFRFSEVGEYLLPMLATPLAS